MHPYHNNPITAEIKELEAKKARLRARTRKNIESINEDIKKLRTKRQKQLTDYDSRNTINL